MYFKDIRCKLISILFTIILLVFLFPVSLHAITFTVNNTADTEDTNPGDGVCADGSGNCTLRAAIMETNALTGADIIELPGGTYTLTIAGQDEDASETGDLDINDDLIINGAGSGITMIDANKIESAINDRTKAIMPVHIGGSPSDLDNILVVANKYGIPVLEDACQAHLAEWRGKKVGNWGFAGGFSFQASKNLNSGEGGAIITNDDNFYQNCYSFQNQRQGTYSAS